MARTDAFRYCRLPKTAAFRARPVHLSTTVVEDLGSWGRSS